MTTEPENVNERARRVLASAAVEHDSADLLEKVNLTPPPAHLGRFMLVEHEGAYWWAQRGNPDPYISAYEVTSGFVYPQRDGEPCGVTVTILTATGERKCVDLNPVDFIKGRGSEALVKLRNAGMRFATSDAAATVIDHLMAVQPPNRLVLDRPGWFKGAFITPMGAALLTDEAIDLAANVAFKGTPAGDLASAKAAAEVIFSGSNRTIQTGWLCGLIGTVLDLTGSDSATYLLEGGSSTGKSTAEQAAVAHWTPPGLGLGLFMSSNATTNAMEAPMERGSGTVVAWDEIRWKSGAETENLIFVAQQGSGKLRASRGEGNRRQAKFRTVMLMSAETGMAQRLASEGRAPAGGLTVRALAIQTEGVPAPCEAERKAIVAMLANHGQTGPAFVQALADQGYVAEPGKWLREIEKLVSELPGTGDSMSARAARLVAYVWSVAKIAQESGLIPKSFNAKRLALKLWSDHRGSGLAPADPAQRAIAHLGETLVSRRGLDVVELSETITGYANDTPVTEYQPERTYREPVAYVTKYRDERVYVVRASKLAGLAGDFASDRALRTALVDGGYAIRPPRSDRQTVAFSSWPRLARAQYVVIKADMIEGAEVTVESAPPAAQKSATVTRLAA